MAYLRLIQNPSDGVTLRRVINVPPRKIGDTTLRALRVWAEAQGRPLMAAAHLYTAIGAARPIAATGGYHCLKGAGTTTNGCVSCRGKLRVNYC